MKKYCCNYAVLSIYQVTIVSKYSIIQKIVSVIGHLNHNTFNFHLRVIILVAFCQTSVHLHWYSLRGSSTYTETKSNLCTTNKHSVFHFLLGFCLLLWTNTLINKFNFVFTCTDVHLIKEKYGVALKIFSEEAYCADLIHLCSHVKMLACQK